MNSQTCELYVYGFLLLAWKMFIVYSYSSFFIEKYQNISNDKKKKAMTTEEHLHLHYIIMLKKYSMHKNTDGAFSFHKSSLTKLTNNYKVQNQEYILTVNVWMKISPCTKASQSCNHSLCKHDIAATSTLVFSAEVFLAACGICLHGLAAWLPPSRTH